MSHNKLLVETCTIQARAAGEDSWNQEEGAWANESTSVKCRFSSTGGQELVVQGDVVLSTHRVHFPAGTTIDETRRIVFGGKNYDILHVNQVKNRSKVHHIEVMTKQVT